MELYIYKNDQSTGPYTSDQIQQLLATGAVLPEDFAWREGMDEW